MLNDKISSKNTEDFSDTKSPSSKRGTMTQIVLMALVVIFVRILVEKLIPLFYEGFGLNFNDFIFKTLSNYALTISMVIIDYVIVHFLIRKIHYGKNYFKRAGKEFLYVFILSFLSSIILKLTQFNDLEETPVLFDRLLLFTCIVCILFNLVVIILFDLILYYKWIHETALKKEISEKNQADYQYQMLRSQLNPHFLFNSLNVLDYLILTNQEKASTYVKRLASIYRYMLQIESNPIVTVEEEMSFIKQYINLLNERFSAGVRFSIDITKRYSSKKIIPCTLQMMIENAVKHNIANASNVLRINIFVKNNYFIVTNNIQPKLVSAPSSGLGLKNIKEQYQLIFHKEIKIINNGKTFEVRIPIVN